MKQDTKILILTYNMIPYSKSWGSCQRIYFLAEHLTKRGYKTLVASSKNTFTENFFNQEINFQQEIFKLSSRKNKSKQTEIVGDENRLNSNREILKKYLLRLEKLFFNEPVTSLGIKGFLWALKFSKDIEKIVNRENITTIIISAPPFSLFWLLIKMKSKLDKCSIIIDYRDPWNLWDGGNFFTNFIEKKILKIASHVTVTTDSLKDGLSKKFTANPEKISIIYNGYSEKAWNKITSLNKRIDSRIILSYIGTISFTKDSYRDISNFLQAYDSIRSDDIYKIKFVGVNLEPELSNIALKYPEIEFITKVTPEESYMHMVNSDVLMNLHTANDNSAQYLIGGKIFDYLRSNKTILSINSKQSFEQKFLFNKENVYCTENIVDKIRDVLKTISLDIVEDNKKNRINSIKEYSREFQNEKFLKLICELQKSHLK